MSSTMLRLYAAGSNGRGQLGSADCDDHHTFVLVSEGLSITKLACGANHTLALLDTGELWACGDATRGQLLRSESSDVFRRIAFNPASYGLDGYTISGIAACWETTFISLTPITSFNSHPSEGSDVIVSFGANDFGDRGVGPSPPIAEPTTISFQNVEFPGIPTPHQIRVRELATGPHHIVASLDVWAAPHEAEPVSVLVGWGASRHGQLGSVPAAPTPKSKSQFRPGAHATHTIDKPIVIAVYRDEGSRPRRIAAGSQHTLVLHNSGRITRFGSSRRGQLDIPKLFPNNEMNARQIGCTWMASLIASCDSLSGWRIDACGSSNHGQLGRGDNPSPGSVALPAHATSTQFHQLASGSEHVLVHAGNEVWAWGWNEHGNLGIGHQEDVHTPVRVWPPEAEIGNEERVINVWAGCGTSWILIKCENPEGN
ncbi:hypothetical protein CTheo_3371 [Ceratobasidium theobromae]|uniref:RCC1/BLIP-II protein n=1 Tax=Ceratobasidium theobromae TaxID=1582974 RepID=A0A5N5QNP4_9AGAM|nr:hypothetical protein CTheo_3371 [Ceratobasidium theobromae]